MRALLRLAPLALLALAPSCGLFAGFDIEQGLAEQTVPGNPALAALGQKDVLFQVPFRIDIDAQTKAQGGSVARSVSVKSLQFTVTQPAGETFEFLDSLTIAIAAPGLQELEIAKLPNVPATGSITMEVIPSADLLPYLKDKPVMKAHATGHAPAQPIRFGGTLLVHVSL